MSEYKVETKCVQSGYKPKNGEPRVMPIYQSTTYKFDSSEHLGDLFDGFPARLASSRGRSVNQHVEQPAYWDRKVPKAIPRQTEGHESNDEWQTKD